MDISKLTAIIPPPKNPIAPGSPEQWRALEESIDTHLPTDYKALIDTYGQGWFKGLVSVLNPFAEPGWHESRAAFERMWKWREEHDPNYEYTPKYPLFSESGGLLIWGWDYNCGVMCWITEGAPDSGPTISMDNKYSSWSSERYEASIVELLCIWLSGGPALRHYDSAEEGEDKPIQTIFFPGAESPFNL